MYYHTKLEIVSLSKFI